VTGNPSATKEDVFEDVIKPGAISLTPANLSYDVQWFPDKRQGSFVEVRVTYLWIPEVFLGGIRLSSTSRVPVSY
jgi:hypothetical protein